MAKTEKITCLGKVFSNEDERRENFRNELRKKLPELKKIEGFPIGDDEAIIALSDPPYYTVCPNPWLNEFISEWDKDKSSISGRKKSHHVDEPYASDVSEGKNSPIYIAHSYHTKVPHPAIMRYILQYTQPGDIILDGFAGTGMTGVASTLCGNPEPDLKYTIEKEWKQTFNTAPVWGKRNCINSDLSPLAGHISSVYNNANIDDDIQEIEKALDELTAELSYLYETNVKGKTKKVNHFIWSSVIACENCNEPSPYFDIAYKHQRLSSFKRLEEVRCPHCGSERTSRGLPVFENTVFDPIIKQPIQVASIKLSLINYFEKKTKTLKLAEDEDVQTLNKVNQELQKRNIPSVLNPGGVNLSQALKSHGYKYLHQFYPERSLLVIDSFLKLTANIKSSTPLFILTSTLPKLTKLNRYMPEHGGRALVGPRANTLYVPPLFVENNAIEQLKFQFAKAIKAISVAGKQVIQVASTVDLKVADNSIDYVFTDPPFGGNIMYSELNMLSESWLKVVTNNHSEVITNDAQGKSLVEYEQLMVRCFEQYLRVLKPGSWMTVEFSNSSAAVWNVIQHGLRKAGFLIVSVDILDKQRPGFVGMIGPNAVKEDLAISCLKPKKDYRSEITLGKGSDVLWDITEEIISNSTIIQVKNNNSSQVVSRDPRVLWDRVVSYFITNGHSIPLDLAEFRSGLSKRFVERDGMYFTAAQVDEYDEQRKNTRQFVQLTFLVTNESEGIEWIRQELAVPQTYQTLQPKWMQSITAVRKGDVLPELRNILEENFICGSNGVWRVADLNEAKDRELRRIKFLLKEFDGYLAELSESKSKKLKEVRVESLRAGFKACWEKKDFQTIVFIGERIPQDLLLEDEQLLMYYDIARDKV